MDEFDIKILSYLQKDGRTSFQDMGEAVGLSLSACHKRVKALEETGIIKRYTVLVDEEALGFKTSAYVQVHLKDQKQETLDAFEEHIIKQQEIMDCSLIAGNTDYLLRILCGGVEDYERIHRDILTKLPGVERLNSNFALRTICRRTEIPVELKR